MIFRFLFSLSAFLFVFFIRANSLIQDDFVLQFEEKLYFPGDTIKYKLSTSTVSVVGQEVIIDVAITDLNGKYLVFERSIYDFKRDIISFLIVPSQCLSGYYSVGVNDVSNSSFKSFGLVRILDFTGFNPMDSLISILPDRSLPMNTYNNLSVNQFSGRLHCADCNWAMGEVILFYYFRNDDLFLSYAPINTNGEFAISNFIFLGIGRLYFAFWSGSSMYLAPNNVKIDFTSVPFILESEMVSVDSDVVPLKGTDLPEIDFLKKSLVNISYNNFVSGESVASISHTSIFWDKEFLFSDYIDFKDINDAIKTIMSFKRIKQDGIFLLNRTSKEYAKRQPLFFINDTLVADYKSIQSLSISDVIACQVKYPSLELQKKFGYFGQSGIVRIITKSVDSKVSINGLGYMDVRGISAD